MFLIVLGVLDIIVGVLLGLATGNPFIGSGIIFAFGVIWVLKGLFSLLSSISSGFYFDVMGIMDLFTGVFLLLSTNGIVFWFFLHLGILMVLKGLYSFVMGWIS